MPTTLFGVYVFTLSKPKDNVVTTLSQRDFVCWATTYKFQNLAPPPLKKFWIHPCLLLLIFYPKQMTSDGLKHGDNINPDYTGLLHVGRFAWGFLSHAISLIFKRDVSFFQYAS